MKQNLLIFLFSNLKRLQLFMDGATYVLDSNKYISGSLRADYL